MNVSPTFYDIMVRTEPEKMRLLKGYDSIASLIPVDDPIFKEVELSYDARRYGITTDEMRRREEETLKCYVIEAAGYVCAEAIRWGLSEGVYKRRQVVANKLCVASKEDEALLARVEARKRRDHEIVVRLEACDRKAMLSD
jgi:hypothetical protein